MGRFHMESDLKKKCSWAPMSGQPKLGPRKDPGKVKSAIILSAKLSICDGSDVLESTCYMRRMNQMCNGIFPHSSGRVGKEGGGWRSM